MVINRIWGTSVLLATLALSAPCGAQTNASTPRAIPNRYLLVVETSRSMHHRKDGTLAAVHELLRSGLSGQLRSGDSIGVWTFSSELHAGQFPLQVWLPTHAQEVTDRVLSFLATQKYSGQARFDKVVPTLQQVVGSSEFITIVLVTSGTQTPQGMPFAENLNKFYSSWHDQQEKAHMPFLAALRGEKGKLADFAVNVAPWKLELPALPPQLLVARTLRKPAASAKAAKPVMLPPLVISGRKPTPAAAPSAAQSTPSQSASASVARLAPTGPGTTTATVAAQGNTGSSTPVRTSTDTVISQTERTASPTAAGLALASNEARSPSAVSASVEPSDHVQTVAPSSAFAEQQSSRTLAATEAPTSSAAEPIANNQDLGTPTANQTAPYSLAPASASELPAPQASTVIASAPATLLVLRIGLLVFTVVLLAWFARFWLTRSRGRAHISVITRSFERK